ncbi:unnamed protein product [Rhizopus stolonifer]
MVQCDNCEVWQHCPCIGLEAQKIPRHYYCEMCHSKSSNISKNTSERPKRFYDAASTELSGDMIADSKRTMKRRRKAEKTKRLVTLPPITTEKTRTVIFTEHRWNYSDTCSTSDSYIPAKVKYPHSKMTFFDMNKRTHQMMDYIDKMKSKNEPNDNCLISLQSPLTPKPLAYEETSTDMMEKIQQKILKFQKQFGEVESI